MKKEGDNMITEKDSERHFTQHCEALYSLDMDREITREETDKILAILQKKEKNEQSYVKLNGKEVLVNIASDIDTVLVLGASQSWDCPEEPSYFDGMLEPEEWKEKAQKIMDEVLEKTGLASELSDTDIFLEDLTVTSEEDFYDQMEEARIAEESAYADYLYDKWKDERFERDEDPGDLDRGFN